MTCMTSLRAGCVTSRSPRRLEPTPRKCALGFRIADAPCYGGVNRTSGSRTGIVRTWPMRGTLHFLAAADVHWMLELLTPRILSSSATRAAQLGLDDEALSRCRDIMRRDAGGRAAGYTRGIAHHVRRAASPLVCSVAITGIGPRLEGWNLRGG